MKYALLYQPPCGAWYVHSHKLYDSPEQADEAAGRFLHHTTPRAVVPIDLAALVLR